MITPRGEREVQLAKQIYGEALLDVFVIIAKLPAAKDVTHLAIINNMLKKAKLYSSIDELV